MRGPAPMFVDDSRIRARLRHPKQGRFARESGVILQDKVIIITGCNSEIGMGWSAAIKSAEQGADVVLCDYATDKLDQLVSEIKGLRRQAIWVQADVSIRAQVDQAVARAIETFGRIDALINNAGIATDNGPFLECSDDMLERNMAVNFKGAWHFCQAVIPHMKKQGGGAIVNNASLNATRPVAGWAPYTTSKMAMIGMSKSIAYEFGVDNIRSNCIAPGPIRTELGLGGSRRLAEEMDIPFDEAVKLAEHANVLGRWGSPGEAADLMVYLASDMASFVTGSTIDVGGGFVVGL